MIYSVSVELRDNADISQIAEAIRTAGNMAADQLQYDVIEPLEVDDSVLLDIDNDPLIESMLYRSE